jgi:pyridoxamine 5'-phosphate oxidase
MAMDDSAGDEPAGRATPPAGRDPDDAELRPEQLAADPLEQFRIWLQAAEAAGVDQPDAMTLATVSDSGAPSARVVLLKGVDHRGFAFFTDLRSQKAVELAAEPRAALVFVWLPLHRQVRVEGMVERVTDAESDTDFAARVRGGQISIWASSQSREIPDRAVLEARIPAVEATYEGRPVPRPPFWGGFRLRPSAVELWQGRPDRLHDRFRYERAGEGWRIRRLAP